MFFDLACIGCLISSDGHKLLIGILGLSLLGTALVVRSRRERSRTAAGGFEVLPRRDKDGQGGA